ncbi:MAG: DUF11 domain-containing protein [Anaerolineales bacterium]|nr:DUF11 domain-containing protein [Anaerolineales bacterium]
MIATYRDADNDVFDAESGAGVELLPAADLRVVKTVTSGARVPGQSVTYQLLVTNLGPNNVTGATVLDTLPTAVTGVNWNCGGATGGGVCAHASGSGNINETVDLPDDATVTFTVIGTIAADATGNLVNTATVAPPVDITDLITANNSSTDSGGLVPQVILSVTKSSSPKPGLAPGGEVNYVIHVSNSGASDAAGVSVVDTFPDDITGVSWTCTASSGSTCTASGSGNLADTATIQAGGTLAYTATGTVAPATAPGVVIANTAIASYASSPVSATDNNTLVAPTSLTATKDALSDGGASSRTVPFIDADGNGGISPGDTLKYEVVISNGANVAYNVLYYDSLDANTALVVGSVECAACTVTEGNTASDTAVSVSFDSVAAGSAVTIYYRVTVNNPLPFQTASLSNQGLVASSNAPSIATSDDGAAELGHPTVVTLSMGSLGGVAWEDDGDGLKEAGEAVIADLSVALYYAGVDNTWDTDDDQVANAMTDAAGLYPFTVLAAGKYRIDFQLDTGFGYGLVWGDTVDNKVNPDTGNTGEINLAANAQVLTISSGQVPLRVVAHMFNDLNHNGTQQSADPAEPNLGGITMALYAAADCAGESIATGVTVSPTGNYTFSNIVASDYSVKVTIPTGCSTSIATCQNVTVEDAEVQTLNFGAYQDNPTAVILTSFSAVAASDGVLVTWETASEVNTAGFFVYRLDATTGQQMQVNEEIVPALLGAAPGGTYRILDRGAQTGSAYTYLLVEIETGGQQKEYGPFALTTAAPALLATNALDVGIVEPYERIPVQANLVQQLAEPEPNIGVDVPVALPDTFETPGGDGHPNAPPPEVTPTPTPKNTGCGANAYPDARTSGYDADANTRTTGRPPRANAHRARRLGTASMAAGSQQRGRRGN